MGIRDDSRNWFAFVRKREPKGGVANFFAESLLSNSMGVLGEWVELEMCGD